MGNIWIFLANKGGGDSPLGAERGVWTPPPPSFGGNSELFLVSHNILIQVQNDLLQLK